MSATPNILQQLLDTQPWLLADGATGTNLFAVGLSAGYPPELWNTEQPEKIAQLHQGFLDAGADIILTNTFGGSAYRLMLHHAQDRVHELNKAGAALARKQADAHTTKTGRQIVVAGSVGPTGELLEPVGTMSFDQATAAFAEQIGGLKAGGANVIWIETMSDLRELEAALAAAAQHNMPTVATMSFDTAGKTMMGVAPQALASFAATKPLTAFGANCGVGPAELVGGVLHMADACQTHAPTIVAKGNCGIPVFKEGEISYTGTPELMGRYACLAFDAGARIIGGCCGTAPEHLRAMRTALEAHTRGERPTIEHLEASLQGNITAQKDAATLAAERRPRRRG